MTIQEKIDADLKEAMRSKEAERLSVLRMVKSALMNAAIELRGARAQLPDPDAVAVIRRQVKQREDSIEGFQKGGRPELAAKERREIGFLKEYLPKPLTENELEQLVKDAVADLGATSKAQMGAVMKLATEKAAGRVDGRTLSQAVRKALG
ncbi:MAG: GatB/YqeY domain-containing protein [Verrucomicrobia bacterium]|nr:GatB/YqeY domain-containing protein [Verrucomicrobiota bacterium]MBV8532933.1 GatB/YqeY domain-containing protein [Verrucomicrobiota bacterium]